MRSSTFGVLVAGAMVSLIGSAALAQTGGSGETKACYRTHCGKSVKGHEGQCGGTKVDGLGDQKSCEAAGGAWTTEVDAAKFKKNS
jgi:hypothetical protein